MILKFHKAWLEEAKVCAYSLQSREQRYFRKALSSSQYFGILGLNEKPRVVGLNGYSRSNYLDWRGLEISSNLEEAFSISMK